MSLTPREIDALIAEKVMGEVVYQGSMAPYGGMYLKGKEVSHVEVPFYSTDIAAAGRLWRS